MKRSPCERLTAPRNRDGALPAAMGIALLCLVAVSCTGSSGEEASDATTSSSGRGVTTSTTAPAATTELPPTGVPPDPRRGSAADLHDPVARDAALHAMAIDPADLPTDLTYLRSTTPAPWAPLSAPGFLSDKVPLEEPGLEALAPETIQGYRLSYEADFDSPLPAVDSFTIELQLATDPDAVKDALITELEQALEESGLLLEPLEGGPGERYSVKSSDDGQGTAADYRGALGIAVVEDVVVTVTVVAEDRELQQSVLDEAVAATIERVEAVLSGAFGYGPFDSVADHPGSARWTLLEADVDGGSFVMEGAQVAGSGSTCSIQIGVIPDPLELTFDAAGYGVVSVSGVERATTRGAWPQFGSCGLAYPGIPADFSRVESRSVSAFLRDVPDLHSTTGTLAEFEGLPTVRYDLAPFYQRYLDRLFVEISVDRFDIWLHVTGGWVAGYEVELSGDPDELNRNGFGPMSDSSPGHYIANLKVTAVDDPTIELPVTDTRVSDTPGQSRIVFTSNRVGQTQDVYVLEPSGDVRRLTTHPNGDELAALSPDGTSVVFTSRRSGNDSLFLIDADGTNLRRLTAPLTDGGDSWPSWSPDGKAIVFGSDRDGFDDDLWIINVDGTGLRKLFGDPELGEIWPSWSPDGTLIAFISGGDVFTIRPDGTGLAKITSDELDYVRPAWSPDGSQLLVTDQAGRPVMYLMRRDGSDREVLDTGGVAGGFGVFTPDGQYVVFTDFADLWSIRLDGSDLRTLTAHPLLDTVPSTRITPAG